MLVQVVHSEICQALQNPVVERTPNHRGNLQDAASLFFQAVHARYQQGLQVAGNIEIAAVSDGVPVGAALVLEDQALVDEGSHYFFDEVGIALTLVHDAGSQVRGQVRNTQEAVHQFAAFVRTQRLQANFAVAVGEITGSNLHGLPARGVWLLAHGKHQQEGRSICQRKQALQQRD